MLKAMIIPAITAMGSLIKTCLSRSLGRGDSLPFGNPCGERDSFASRALGYITQIPTKTLTNLSLQ
ncbi:hypothetical protein [Microcoleus sp. D2_18a_D3]|uniref:hypothetical protein n=1 Tax=Microcoleus sp. D2_18a_D3 TaxID=3055330 RepID=UPI002FD0F6B5